MLNVIKYRYRFLMISSLVVVVFLGMLVFSGLKPAIDFTGGAIVEVKSELCKVEGCSEIMKTSLADKGIEVLQIDELDDSTFSIKTKQITQDQWEEIKIGLNERFDDFEEKSFETIGPVLGKELLSKTTTAVIFVVLSLMIYIGWRFKSRKYGVTAIVALFHDLVVIVGSFAVFGHVFGVEVDVMFVTATLTALAFSVHDTIVIFDRVRETLRRNPKDDFNTVINIAINSTIVRSLSTSLSIIFVLVAMALLGGGSIFWFVVALLIGTISGSYSSPFLAAPLLAVWEEKFGKGKK